MWCTIRPEVQPLGDVFQLDQIKDVHVEFHAPDLIVKKSGKFCRVGVFLKRFRQLICTTKGPHGACVQMGGRHRIEPHQDEIERLATRTWAQQTWRRPQTRKRPVAVRDGKHAAACAGKRGKRHKRQLPGPPPCTPHPVAWRGVGACVCVCVCARAGGGRRSGAGAGAAELARSLCTQTRRAQTSLAGSRLTVAT